MENASTPYAVLGMLTIAPMSGYEMKQVIERSIRHFWSESYGQLYPTLKRLTEERLATRKVERKSGKPERQVYSITAKGREKLGQWLAEPAREQAIRNEFLLKVFFSSHLPADQLLAHLKNFAVRHKQSVAQYISMEKQLRREHRDNPDLPYWLMTLSFGRYRSQAQEKWAQESIAAVSRSATRKARGKRS